MSDHGRDWEADSFVEPDMEILDSTHPNWREVGRGQLANWLARETRDVITITTEVSKVYCDLTGGLISKPNTLAHHVIAAAEEYFAKIAEDELKDMVTIIEAMENRLAAFDAVRAKFPSAWPIIEGMIVDAQGGK